MTLFLRSGVPVHECGLASYRRPIVPRSLGPRTLRLAAFSPVLRGDVTIRLVLIRIARYKPLCLTTASGRDHKGRVSPDATLQPAGIKYRRYCTPSNIECPATYDRSWYCAPRCRPVLAVEALAKFVEWRGVNTMTKQGGKGRANAGAEERRGQMKMERRLLVLFRGRNRITSCLPTMQHRCFARFTNRSRTTHSAEPIVVPPAYPRPASPDAWQ